MEEDKKIDQQIESVPSENSTEDPSDKSEEVSNEQNEDTGSGDDKQVEKVDEEQEEEERPVSRRENKRIAELTRKLAAKNQDLTPTSQTQHERVIEEGDYDVEELNTIAADYGQRRYSEGLAQANSIAFMTRLEIDAPKIEDKYPMLSPQSESFDPGVTDYISAMYYKAVGLKTRKDGTFTVENPDIRFSEFVEGMMEAIDTIASAREASTKESLVKQSAKQGVRPGGVAHKPFSISGPEDIANMSPAEYEKNKDAIQAYVNSMLPKR